MSQASQVFRPITMRYKMAMQPSTTAKNQIDAWFNGTAAKNAVAKGYESQEGPSILLGQTYISAAVVRPTVQNPTAAPVQPSVLLRGTSEEDPIDVLDSDDELFVELNLTPDQKERVRRRFDRIRSA